MALYEFEGKTPKIGKDTYVAESADIIGDVVIGNKCYIGPGARIKGDYGAIRIGHETSVQENCILHARPDETCLVGNQVTVGHGAILHNCTVQNGAIIGMGAIVSDWAVIGTNALVAEGAVVRQSQQVPEGNVAIGVPAKVIGLVSERVKSEWPMYKSVYVDLARRYQQGLKRIQ